MPHDSERDSEALVRSAAQGIAEVCCAHGLQNSEVFLAMARLIAQMAVKEGLRAREPLETMLSDFMKRLAEDVVPAATHYATCTCEACAEFRAEAIASGGWLN